VARTPRGQISALFSKEAFMPTAQSETGRLQAPAIGDGAGGQPQRGGLGLALAVIATAQLMVVLDATIVNVALPRIQGALGFSGSGLEWVVNAYALTFGGLLLLGGQMNRGILQAALSDGFR
jgi:hypothetical protein